MLFPSLYHGPAGYFASLIQADDVILDVHEHFIKQTLRTRCHILSPNGIQTLIVPVVHDNRSGTPMKDIRISDREKWQLHHWKTIQTCYNRSPYFEYYMDDFAELYNTGFEFLVDLNQAALNMISEIMNMKLQVKPSDDFIDYQPYDLRKVYSTGEPHGDHPSYTQVFTYKFGHVAGLSILDLLFNKGPETVDFLKKVRASG